MNPAGATRFAQHDEPGLERPRLGSASTATTSRSATCMDPAANGECGAWQTTSPSASRCRRGADQPGHPEGWGIRPSDWQFGASVQHEILPRVSVEVGYNRRWFNGFTVTDNRATVASDYDLFSFTAPTGVGETLPVSGQTITALQPAIRRLRPPTTTTSRLPTTTARRSSTGTASTST